MNRLLTQISSNILSLRRDLEVINIERSVYCCSHEDRTARLAMLYVRSNLPLTARHVQAWFPHSSPNTKICAFSHLEDSVAHQDRYLRFLSFPSGQPRSLIQYSRFLTERSHVSTPDSNMITCNISSPRSSSI